ncbi:hypothetical protein MK805_17290 [Shimazuella sp. AN120528]|uniref:hypothetical protein n=1 Tax=Shimazuella soli TaxID=1892854 RepID=UPI001F0D1403|nr:hypothetical protein [Shimazuella soli]MCH5586690.1 hypothetical protein [Shimazuella soli]
MDPRFIQWQNFRPSRRSGQPWNEEASNSDQNKLVRPIQQPSQGRSNQQPQRRGGCCGKRATD